MGGGWVSVICMLNLSYLSSPAGKRAEGFEELGGRQVADSSDFLATSREWPNPPPALLPFMGGEWPARRGRGVSRQGAVVIVGCILGFSLLLIRVVFRHFPLPGAPNT